MTLRSCRGFFFDDIVLGLGIKSYPNKTVLKNEAQETITFKNRWRLIKIKFNTMSQKE